MAWKRRRGSIELGRKDQLAAIFIASRFPPLLYLPLGLFFVFVFPKNTTKSKVARIFELAKQYVLRPSFFLVSPETRTQ